MGVALAAAAALAGRPGLSIVDKINEDFTRFGVFDRRADRDTNDEMLAIAACFVGARSVLTIGCGIFALISKVLKGGELDRCYKEMLPPSSPSHHGSATRDEFLRQKLTHPGSPK